MSPDAGVSYDRLADIWARLAEHAAAYGRRVCVADACAVATKLAGLSGAWVAAARNGAPDFVMCVTDTVCEQLAELQLTVGEGPCRDVLAADAPVLVPDLGEPDMVGRWPAFAPAASGLGAAALFAFPLEVGAARSGVLTLYRRSPGSLPAGALGDLLVVADVATILLLDGADQAADGGSGSSDWVGFDGQAPDLAMHRAEIDQATGMLMARLGLPAAQAFARLRAYAYAHDRRLADVAGDIVARLVRLDADPVPDPDP